MADYNAQTEIYCNNGCGKKFAMADIKPLVEVVQHKSHVERYYFNCPFCGEKYMLVFENEGYCDAIICELDQKSCDYLKNCISRSED